MWNSRNQVSTGSGTSALIPTNTSPTWTNITGNNQDGIASMDVSNYRSGSIQVSGFGTATINVQFNNDGNWIAGPTVQVTSPLTLLSNSGIVANGFYIFPIPNASLMRIRTTSYSSGTLVATVLLSSLPFNPFNNAMYITNSLGQAMFDVKSPGDANTWPSAFGSIQVLPYKFVGANSWLMERTPNIFKVVALSAGTTETTIWTPAGGKKFRLMGFLLTCGAASTLTFKDNTAGTTIFAARGTTDQPISPSGMGNGILSATANNVLTVTRGTSATLDGVVWGTEE
jgi:hypothetical protein